MELYRTIFDFLILEQPLFLKNAFEITVLLHSSFSKILTGFPLTYSYKRMSFPTGTAPSVKDKHVVETVHTLPSSSPPRISLLYFEVITSFPSHYYASRYPFPDFRFSQLQLRWFWKRPSFGASTGDSPPCDRQNTQCFCNVSVTVLPSSCGSFHQNDFPYCCPI